MTQIRFKPWIGDSYWNAPFGKRVLVLGESHYDWEKENPIDDRPSVTTELINEQLEGDYTKAFWTHIAITFLNKRPTLEEKQVFWHKVAFYNFVQTSAGSGPRKRPKSEQFAASEPAFFEVLEATRPELLVVLGYELWEWLPSDHWKYGPKIPHADHVSTGRYIYPGGTCLALCIRHPSSGFNGREWHPIAMDSMKLS